LAVDHASHHGAQADALRRAGHEAERGVGLQHGIAGLADARLDLEIVVHHPQAGEAGRVGGLGDAVQRAAGVGRAAGPVECDDL
jgi:hypothetical protein